jgi:hypothetical protein
MLLLPLLACAGSRILMLGNSHTAVNQLPLMVRTILNTDAKWRPVTMVMRTGPFLEDLARNPAIRKEVAEGKWDVIVLQGAKVSSSHRYRYSQAGGIVLAKLAMASGARTLLFAEWPRKGENETEFILNVYGEIGRAAKVEVVPTGRAWDTYRSKRPQAALWQEDGNHASPMGSMLTAYTIACWIRRSDEEIPRMRLPEVAPEAVPALIEAASKVWRKSAL